MKINSSPIVPLGAVHNDKKKWEIIEQIDAAWKQEELDLWGYMGERGVALLPIPKNEGYSLNWFGGPGRERGDNPDFPGVSYYCDVRAVIWPREDALGLNLADQAKPEWTRVQIREKDWRRLHDQLNRTGEPTSALGAASDSSKERAITDEADRKVAHTRNRGRVPKVFSRVKQEMISDILTGARDPRKMLEKEWSDTYHASRDTCRRALREAELESPRIISTNLDNSSANDK